MKPIKNFLFLLLAGTLFTFSACNESEEPFEIIEPAPIPGTYNVQTYQPDISSDKVVFKGSLSTNDDNIEYGFMWYVKPENANEQALVVTVPVGRGALNGSFSIPMTDLPKNVALVVCAFVEFQVGVDTTQEIGQEIDFDWDL